MLDEARHPTVADAFLTAVSRVGVELGVACVGSQVLTAAAAAVDDVAAGEQVRLVLGPVLATHVADRCDDLAATEFYNATRSNEY